MCALLASAEYDGALTEERRRAIDVAICRFVHDLYEIVSRHAFPKLDP